MPIKVSGTWIQPSQYFQNYQLKHCTRKCERYRKNQLDHHMSHFVVFKELFHEEYPCSHKETHLLIKILVYCCSCTVYIVLTCENSIKMVSWRNDIVVVWILRLFFKKEHYDLRFAVNIFFEVMVETWNVNVNEEVVKATANVTLKFNIQHVPQND